MFNKKRFCAIVLVLLSLYGSPIFSDYVSTSPRQAITDKLMRAIACKQSPKEIKRLIVEGANVSAVDFEFLRCVKPVLRYALDRGTDSESVEIIKMLVNAGADVNEITYNRVQDESLYGIMPLLTYAAIYSSAEIVQIFIDAGARDTILSESPISFTKSALMIAKELGRLDVVKVLIQ